MNKKRGLFIFLIAFVVLLSILSAVNIQIIHPTNNTYWNINTLDINYTNGTDTQACWYSNDTYTINITLPGCINITDVIWNEGPHNITIWTNNSTGSENFSIITFTIDTIKPNINFVSPTPINNTISKSVYVNVSTSDANNHSAFIDFNRSLIGWWNFDFYNSSGIYDNSTYSNFGTFNGNLSVSKIVNAKRGMGAEFDGADDYLQVANESNFDFTSNFTLEAWIKPTGNDVYNAIIGKYLVSPLSGWDWILQDGRIRMNVRGTSGIDSTQQGNDLRDSNWHHIVAVITNTSIQQYVDGAPMTPVPGNWTPTTNNINVTIGMRDTGLTDFNGTMDEVRIYSRALTLEEVRASYNAGAYKLSKNFIQLSEGNYTYKAYVIDAAGNVNSTEERTVTIDTTPPNINFTFPTPANATNTANTSIFVNVSTNDTNEHSAWIDWNKSLAGWWSFDFINSSGGIYDNSSYNRHGRLINHSSNTTVYGIRGQALDFGGRSYIDTADIDLQEWTISAWFKINESKTGSDLHTIVAKWQDSTGTKINYHLDIRTGKLRAVVSNSSGTQAAQTVSGTTTINVGQWYYGVATFKDEILKVYLNGVEENQLDTNFSSPYTATTLSTRIGAFTFPWTLYKDEFNGTLDEIMLFSRALTPEEINASYNAGTYRLFNNFTNLSDRRYTYKAYAIDAAGNVNSTEERTLTLDAVFPNISFVFPTPSNNSFQPINSVYLNVSTPNTDEHSAFIDWNRTLRGWWNFEYVLSNGTIRDNSSYNRHAILINSTINTTVFGKRGEGLEFIGKDYYVNLGIPLNNNSEWTYSLWFYPRTNSPVISAMIGQGNNPAMRWGGGLSRVYLFLGCLNCTPTQYKQINSPDLTLNQWHYSVGVFNLSDSSNESMSLYIDGVRVAYTSWNLTTISNATHNGTIVRPTSTHYLNIRDSARTYNGTLDEVMVFSRALTAGEINASYNAGVYKLYNNFTNLSDVGYTYRAYAIDGAGNIDKTEERIITIDTVFPDINFTASTPENATNTKNTSIFINVSTNDINEHSAFIDFNQSLIGWWNFENVLGNGTVYDNSIYENNGRMVGFTLNTTVSGKRGKALDFDGINDFVNVTDSNSLKFTNNLITISLWAKISNVTDSQYRPLIVKRTGANSRIDIGSASSTLYFTLSNGTGYTNFALSNYNNYVFNNIWHYFVFVVNSTDSTIFIDAIPRTSQANLPGLNLTVDANLVIGARPIDSTYFNGTIDEVMIFNRALSSQEINASYRAGTYQLLNNFTNLSDGNYTYRAYAIDAAGNVNSTEERLFTIEFPFISNETAEVPSAQGGACTYDWVCSEWYPEPCLSDGIQKRVCVNKGTCSGKTGMPELNRTCVPEIIEPSEPLFDVFLNIPIGSKWILPGDNVSFDVNIVNMGNATTIDVFFRYWVVDESGRLITEKKETRAIGKEDRFRIDVILPGDLNAGVYKVYVEIDYDSGKIALAGDSFEIVKDNLTIILKKTVSLLPFILTAIIIILLLVIIIERRHHPKIVLKKEKKITKPKIANKRKKIKIKKLIKQKKPIVKKLLKEKKESKSSGQRQKKKTEEDRIKKMIEEVRNYK